MPSIQIAGVRTMNQSGQNATLFNPLNDALSLTLDLAASADLVALPNASFAATFEIIDPLTNNVVVKQSYASSFLWGQYFWISLGNNWGPPDQYDTPQRWGLTWGWTPSIYGFRGLIGAYYAPPDGSGQHTVDAIDVSDIRWFNLELVFSL